ncbi:universal stress protein [Flavobacterium sp. SOK18b]|mgnify:CR=1 FL=1|jgi:nucleotide-binding universal stress UspA family protein|uniref:Universal stress protein n=2 Tax=Flavobacterium TaxID=237 RepID=A0A4R5ATI0_9FLAO|nr:universal stress protein [Flavobacterium sp. SOK18b]PIF62797.1 nucleotide-binding universal stress UspA family protein [Flavobacterium sp. 11]TDD74414.1 universal stress protein [Flavobacterium caseinilyticum]
MSQMRNEFNGEKRMKILLATDGSKYSKTAINEIANRPFPPKTEVCILAAYEITSILNTLEPMGVSHEYNAKFDENAFKNAEKNAKSAAEILENKNPNLLVTTKIVAGSPKSVILNEAEKFKADLIIVGSHGYGAIERFVLGSVSHSVALHAKCSVEIVRK